MGPSVTQPPDLSLRLRQQQLPLAQSPAEDDRDVRLFIFPCRGQGAEANTSGRNQAGEDRSSIWA